MKVHEVLEQWYNAGRGQYIWIFCRFKFKVYANKEQLGPAITVGRCSND